MDSFNSHQELNVNGRTYRYASLPALTAAGHNLDRLPYATKILLENLLRREDGEAVSRADIEAVANWNPQAQPSDEIAFMPARVLLQDFTGVPAVVDLAAMRDAMASLGGDPEKINPLLPAELVIDHSVQIDSFGRPDSFQLNADLEFSRNRERYAFLRWGQQAFQNFKVVPPDTGIIHQINLEYLARVAFADQSDPAWVYPDTLVGTDSHTTMINGLGVLGWGVGGIEAEAAMLGQPLTMLLPQVVGFKLVGELAEGATATDLVLRVVEMLRQKGVVGKFVEFFGSGLANLALADRATIANMGPEYGATCGIFPVDEAALEYLRFSGRPPEQVELVEAYMRTQGLFHTVDTPEAEYSETLELDMSTVEPCLAGPKRPQDRISLKSVGQSFRETLAEVYQRKDDVAFATAELEEGPTAIKDGAVVIASITSCTNTSNPAVMLAAGLVARKAVARGLSVKPWVKTSLAPGSLVVTDYLQASGLLTDLEQLKFHLVGYGCATCIGNSGPLPEPVAKAIETGDLVAVSVLSGNRNFEGRVHPLCRANYLASPPLVVIYALAGRIDIDLDTEPLGQDADGNGVYLKDIWPTNQEITDTVKQFVTSEMFQTSYADVFSGSDKWQSLEVPSGSTYTWEDGSTYVRHAPFFQNLPATPEAATDLSGARVLALLGDSVTTDHISPAGPIKPDSPAGKYLQEQGVRPEDFNSYGSRRGNHEVMMRGTFANIRLRNLLAPGTEGGVTRHLPAGQEMSIYDAAQAYAAEEVPLLVIAGKEYGTGSSRDWAAKGTCLLGVRAVLAESFERIHRSNLVGMGVIPLQFQPGESASTLELNGEEVFDISGLADLINTDTPLPGRVKVTAKSQNGTLKEFEALVRIDTPQEREYCHHGGILQFVLRRLLAE